MRQQSGLTLIELMVTVAIIGIMLSVGVPMMAEYVEIEDTRRTGNTLAQDLRYARDAAQGTSSAIVVAPINGDWATGWQLTRLVDNTVIRITGGVATPVISNTAAINNPGAITFTPQGRTGNNFVFNIRRNRCNIDNHTVTVNPVGQVIEQEIGGCL